MDLKLSELTEYTGDGFRTVGSRASDLVRPTLRIGVTGLARAGKTVFLTSLVNNLIDGGRLPFFQPWSEGRILKVYLEPQSDDAIPRFEYETHRDDLFADNPRWPESTRNISQLRLTIEYQPTRLLKRALNRKKLSLEILDYPGEWLLDLPLLNLNYREWSQKTIADARRLVDGTIASEWLSFTKNCNPQDAEDEQLAMKASALFKDYLRNCQHHEIAWSAISPGRFLFPGDYDGSPALTFCPLEISDQDPVRPQSLEAMMTRRFESYKTHLVKPFFRNHFTRLDRQIVLVDAMQGLNGGREVLMQLEDNLTRILNCFRPGYNSWLTSIWRRRIDRILFAATKVDHLHSSQHKELENVLATLVAQSAKRAEGLGTALKTVTLSSFRATREGLSKDREPRPCVIGVPLQGQRIGDQVFDGAKEVAIFPGDIPRFSTQEDFNDPRALPGGTDALRFVQFQPLRTETTQTDSTATLPHVRMDQVMNFLIGDYLT